MKTREWYFQQLIETRPKASENYIPFVIHANAITIGDVDVLHKHMDFFALMIVRQGRGRHVIDGAPYAIGRGDVYVMRPGATHLWTQFDDLIVDSCYFTMQVFDPDTLDALRETPGFLPLFVDEPSNRAKAGERWLHLTPQQYEEVKVEFARLREEWDSQTHIGTVLTRYIFVSLLAHLAKFYAERPVNETEPPASSAAATRIVMRDATVVAAARYIEDNYATPLSVEQIADAVFLSPGRLRAVFISVMGRTPHDYLRFVRIERAKVLLRTTDELVTKISMDVGFEEPSYFGRVFHEDTGMTPTEYRKQALQIRHTSF